MFTAEEIRARLRESPFVPVEIVTTAGDVHGVHHPDMVIVTRRYLDIGQPTADSPGVAELINRVAILHITELRDIPARSPSQNSNGPPA
jgi:hypothetical protein